MEQMKEKFSKLLLGEDMSGGGKGVSSALALSNVITNLAGKLTSFKNEILFNSLKPMFFYILSEFAASVFGEQHKLAPMKEDSKKRWRKEVDWVLSVTNYISEFVPVQHTARDGSNMEVI
ncbi:putative PRONE domain, Rop guanine nucleotide exchange factor [Helianthus annuus]|nr:putative PRONE domain, Rop guanine nucleotide exchange factor [Helianthus annuus]KAJ0766547.1 putative PRONE domain, Rop guanine nucleotide exchange factor [Helianthus annuus]KAJ0772450.1 putative PRONE domain, Rop guanine nucleotide exchange factor [Helianthus annuus]